MYTCMLRNVLLQMLDDGDTIEMKAVVTSPSTVQFMRIEVLAEGATGVALALNKRRRRGYVYSETVSNLLKFLMSTTAAVHRCHKLIDYPLHLYKNDNFLW